MTESSKLLIHHGFLTDKGKALFAGKSRKEIDATIQDLGLTDDTLEEYADHHEMEISAWQMQKTSYPKPNVTQGDYFPDPMYYRIIWETFQRPIESFYFFLVDQFKDLGFGIIEKITDVFAASEQSSFYGVQQQRIGLHQDKIAQFLRGISELIRGLFQITREIRIIDERLQYYTDTKSKDPRRYDPAEIALKGLYVDLVEGGTKNAASVFGMARELQFTTLPDLFFSTHPRTKDDIKKVVDNLKFNKKVKEVLKRKLYSYMTWRDATHKEMQTRRKHTIKYLRQHYDVIQLYMTWVKPYLKQVNRLSQDSKKLDSPDLVAAFEGSMIELELIGRALPQGNSKYFATIICNVMYRTSPTMPFQQDYQRGPLHQGKVDITWRYYAWTEEDVKRYKAMRQEESFELISNVNESIQAAMDELGDDLRGYLEEAGETFGGEVVEKLEKPSSILDLLTSPFKGFTESFGALFPKGEAAKLMKISRSALKKQKAADSKEIAKATMMAKGLGWLHFRNFKKAHGLVTW